jgi:hypothetical protein
MARSYETDDLGNQITQIYKNCKYTSDHKLGQIDQFIEHIMIHYQDYGFESCFDIQKLHETSYLENLNHYASFHLLLRGCAYVVTVYTWCHIDKQNDAIWYCKF